MKSDNWINNYLVNLLGLKLQKNQKFNFVHWATTSQDNKLIQWYYGVKAMGRPNA